MTYPAEGVMATRPTTAPIAAPIADGLRPRRQSKNIHTSMAVAEAVFVFRKALIATPSAANEEPALNPNQPSQSMDAPNITYGIFAGVCVCSLLLPRKMAPAKAATPEEACTTIPPAKSINSHLAKESVRMPGPVCKRAIYKDTEQNHEHHISGKTDAFCKRSCDKEGVIMANFI